MLCHNRKNKSLKNLAKYWQNKLRVKMKSLKCLYLYDLQSQNFKLKCRKRFQMSLINHLSDHMLKGYFKDPKGRLLKEMRCLFKTTAQKWTKWINWDVASLQKEAMLEQWVAWIHYQKWFLWELEISFNQT